MITPKELIESFRTFRTGDKTFCKLASVMEKDNNVKKYFGFWLEVIENNNKLVLLIQFESLRSDEPIQTVVFSEEAQLENFVESARQNATYELERIVCRTKEQVFGA